jgi:L-2,4-diaminobutyrate decarboxylase
MPVELQDILDAIEADMNEAVGREFAGTVARYLEASRENERPVSTRQTPEQLAAAFGGTIKPEGMSIQEVLERVERDVVQQSNWLYHPRYMGHQVSAPLPAAIWTDAIASALNQSIAVQEMSPALTMVEMELIRWFCGLAGFTEGTGTLTSGGTEATFTAMAAARAALLPDAWENGLSEPLPVVLCGEHAHYAVTRAAAQLGLGLKRVLLVKSAGYRMEEADLRNQLALIKKEGVPVMAVVATAGSTATGSFDDLNAIADVCDEDGIWLHVDGAHGASALLSPKHRQSVAGIDRARSIAWDPHKMMLMPLSVGVLLMRSPADLDAAFRQKAPYLFHGGAGVRSWDQGGRSFQCSRRADALKLWVALQRYGTEAFGVLYDHLCGLAMDLHDRLDVHPDFEVMHRPESNILCFRFKDANDPDELNVRLRTTYNSAGTGWITTTLLNGVRVLRVTLMNPRTTTAHLDQLVEELAETARQLR